MAAAENIFNFPKLSRDNFKQWKFNIKLMLMNSGLGEFIEKGGPEAPSKDAAEILKFKNRQDKALSIICLSIEEDLKNIVYNATTPAEAWKEICTVFEPSSRARIAALRMKFMNTSFSTSDTMSAYLSKVLEAAKDLELAGKKVPDDEVAYQMLANLPQSYDNITMQLYQLEDKEFSSENVRKLLLAEFDRIKYRNESSGDSSRGQALLSTKSSSTRFVNKSKKCFKCGRPGHFAKNCRVKPESKLKSATSKDNFSSAMFASAYLTKPTDIEFVIDSAATDHFCKDSTLFSDFREIRSEATIAEGTTNILGIGNIHLNVAQGNKTVNLYLKDVLYTPGMSRNLISVRKLDFENFSVLFHNRKMIIKNFKNERLLSVPLNDKFYVVYGNCVKKDSAQEAHISGNDVMLWHARFGHLNCRGLKDFSKSNNVYGLDKLTGEVKKCEICLLAKSNKESFPEIENIRTTKILELVHLDVWGPAPIKSMGGAGYFLSVIDDFSRYSVIYFMKYKNEAFEYFKLYKTEMERQTGSKILSVKTDNGSEFEAKYFTDFLSNEGIKIQRTNIYSPQMNGVAERYNRTLVEGVRSLLLQGNLPKTLWAELIYTQNYLRNRFPHKKLQGKAPLNVWNNKNFSVKHLKVIGCLAYVHIHQRYRNKLESKAKKGVLVGYARKTIGYRIWYPGTDKVIETKHVKFNEFALGFKSDFEVNKNVMFKFVHVENSDETKSSMQELDDSKSLDHTVPLAVPDWKRVEITRKTGRSAGRVDVYYYPETGVRLRSKNDVKKYCEDKNIPYKLEDFDFKSKSSVEQGSDSDGLDSDIEAHYVEVKVPNSFNESQKLPEKEKWQNAMVDELNTLRDREVYDIVPRPDNARVLGSKWVYTVKKDISGNVKRFKARLVAQGFKQMEGINYFDTFSPVISFSLVRLFMVILVVIKGWVTQHLDIKCAYLYAKLHETIYIEQPKGFSVEGNYVWKLKKALYGLHQSGREWFFELDRVFLELGFNKIVDCNCVYTFNCNVIVLVYVDDLAIFAANENCMKTVIELIKSKFDVKELGKISQFLGVEFEEKDGKLYMHQKGYIEKLAQTFEIPKFKNKLPLTPGIILNACTEDDDQARDIPYRQLIGCLLFLASRTRPDILCSVIMLSQFSSRPSWLHWKLLCQVLQYVISTKDFYINLSRATSYDLRAYTDASWASDRVDRKSISGYVIFVENVPIIWCSVKQRCTALSSMEAEYIALSDTVKEILWLLRILENFSFLNLPKSKPKIYCDSQSAIHFSRNSVENQRTKYIDTRYYFLKENLHREVFELIYVQGNKNVADLFTKALPSEKFNCYCKWLFG